MEEDFVWLSHGGQIGQTLEICVDWQGCGGMVGDCAFVATPGENHGESEVG
jgi:hypothetical protein